MSSLNDMFTTILNLLELLVKDSRETLVIDYLQIPQYRFIIPFTVAQKYLTSDDTFDSS